MTLTVDYPDYRPLNEQSSYHSSKIIYSVAEVTIWLEKFPQFEEYFAKQGKI